jgi:hypothetical protein
MNLFFQGIFMVSPKPPETGSGQALKGLRFVIARPCEAILQIRMKGFGQDCFVPRNDVIPTQNPFSGLGQKETNA